MNNAFQKIDLNVLVKLKLDFLSGVKTKLECSEWLLIEFMVSLEKWTAPVAKPPADYLKLGEMEFGIFLFLLNNQDYITDPDAREAVELLYPFFKILGLPDSYITVEQYIELDTSTAIYNDGSVVSTSTYAAYDQKWIIALYNSILTEVFDRKYNNGILPIPSIPYSPIVIKPNASTPNQITVGMLADWGAGIKMGKPVLSTLTKLSPDCVIHLGDVYYSGTPSQSDDPQYSSLGEELQNFVNLWPSAWAGKSFTLNSNHEMYCGANGLFEDVLLPNGSPFSSQGANTIFALNIGDWTILGLDSAYNSDPISLYMNGVLDPSIKAGIPAGTIKQTEWIKSLNLNPKKTIVLTHHTGFDYNCNPKNEKTYYKFWNEVQRALGDDPYAWYWGHIHNGIVYTNPVTIAYSDDSNAKKTFTTSTYCRCLGNGSLPYGTATDFITAPSNIEWFAGKGDYKPSQKLPNGFATLLFDLNNKVVNRITENFYLANSATPAYSKALFSNQ